ncbi:N-acetyltransferase [Cetobacterium somerae]|uniref:GNAT family N-acetyltransferase n=1 Tax=Cetobacterium somerae TaxID=188913 RepID=UPI00211E89D7|nr:GNAT family N-acetyltransferase [Cetobacterium somerae]MCQ9628279.1 N-acetyltransferase [Cetobacterium somerae]
MKIIHDEKNSKFYITNGVNIEIAELIYSINSAEKTLKLSSTWVEEEYRNQNLATTLTEKFIEFAKLNNLKIIPICSFGKAYFKRHNNKYQDIIFSK